MKKQVDLFFEKAKNEFLQSGKTIPEILIEKGYVRWSVWWMPPNAYDHNDALTEQQALSRVLKNWYN